ncbi:tetratricopeptide repeat protein [Akkermansiaceae bacterium]|nr:tetratricopeptide repeat protein [Akkermansiaceae bacterium]
MKGLFFLLALSSFVAAAEDGYELIQPRSEIYTDLRESLIIVAEHAVEIGELKPHPKIIWLDRSIDRSVDRLTGQPMMNTELGFVVRAPGVIKFPPIPVVIENKSFFLRLDDITAERNPAPKDFGRLDIIWNDDIEMPKVVHLGEALEIDFIGQLPDDRNLRPRFGNVPFSRVENANWYLFSRQAGRNARPSDYFYNFGRGGFYSKRYDSRRVNLNGKPVYTHRYTARMICSELGEVSGHLGLTMETTERNGNEWAQHERTYLVPFRFEVVPLPPLPNERAFNTGLVGDWKIKSNVGPSAPSANEPLAIRIDIKGHGDPNLREDFDFSREGFASVESKMLDRSIMNHDEWEGTFVQTLIPSGNIATFPPITLASFDTVNDEWKLHQVSPVITLQGQSDVTHDLSPSAKLGGTITRPVLLNLPRAIFPIVALAPFLPFFFGFLKKRLDQRDPVRKARQQKIRTFISRFGSGKGNSEAIDDELLPLLREHLKLPAGAATREVADTLESKHGELSSLLREHSKSSFSSTGSGIDLKALAAQLAKVSFLFILIGQLRGASLNEANQAFSESRYSDALQQYQALIEEDPGRPRLYQNLALTYLAVDDPARARAACRTALLLAPLNSDSRALMDDIRKRVGAPALPGTSLLALRPDQWFILAAIFWVLAFSFIGLRHFPGMKIPRWLVPVSFFFAIVFLATGAWRNTNSYAEQQFMVIGDDIPRELTPGTPDWDFPTLESGLIVKVAEKSDTHARIEADDSSFWIPLSQLKQVW